MDLGRINPVTLITGAASGLGAACAKILARQSQGGLILCDLQEKALSDTADELESLGVAPERVSTLAFDVADPDRWAQASSFIHSQYGRLDWAVVTTAAPAAPAEETDLVDWSRGAPDLNGAFLALRTVMPLMRANTQGGAIVVSALGAAIKSDPGGFAPSKGSLLQLVRDAADDGAPGRVRLNAIATEGAQTPMWAALPWFNDLVRETGTDDAAFDKIASLSPRLARYAQGDGVVRLIAMLLSDESRITGATLLVDEGQTL